MSKKILVLLISVLLIAVAADKTPLAASPDQITIPQMINYQGKLTNTSGAPVADSNYTMTFRFFPTLTGGTSLWAETQTVTTHSGLFNVLLGNTIPIANIPADGNCYLEMQVNPNPAMAPRIRIVSAAYSFLSKKADTAYYATSASVTRPISPPIATTEIADDAVNSAKILNGTITRSDVTTSFKSPYADTSDYTRAANIAYVDSSRIAADAHKLQGLDTTEFDNRYVNENQVNSVSSSMIIDNTIQRNDVVPTFKAPFADTADFARNVNNLYVDSARIATNAHKLQNKDTIALSAKFVDEGQTNSITTEMIINNSVNNSKLADDAVSNQKLADNAVTNNKILNGTIIRDDVTNNFKAPYADTADYAMGAPLSRPISPQISSSEISDDAVTSAKILDGTINSSDISTPLALRNSIPYPNAILNIKNTGTGRGILIDSAGFGAFAVKYAFTDGVNIGYALQYGVYIDSAGGDGMFISNAGIDGIGINNAGWDGLFITNAGLNGVEMTEVAYDGMYVMHAAGNGITIDDADNLGVYAQGNSAGGCFVAGNTDAAGLFVHAYADSSEKTAIQAYGKGFATGGWFTGGLFGDKSAPCLISPEMGIISSGTATLSNKQAEISFDPVFTENIRTDIPIRITVTPKGKPAGFIYVTESKASGFKVELEAIPGLEKNNSDIAFDWIAFGTLKENQTSAQAQAQWQKMIQEREARQSQAKARNEQRKKMQEEHKKLEQNK